MQARMEIYRFAIMASEISVTDSRLKHTHKENLNTTDL